MGAILLNSLLSGLLGGSGGSGGGSGIGGQSLFGGGSTATPIQAPPPQKDYTVLYIVIGVVGLTVISLVIYLALKKK